MDRPISFNTFRQIICQVCPQILAEPVPHDSIQDVEDKGAAHKGEEGDQECVQKNNARQSNPIKKHNERNPKEAEEASGNS